MVGNGRRAFVGRSAVVGSQHDQDDRTIRPLGGSPAKGFLITPHAATRLVGDRSLRPPSLRTSSTKIEILRNSIIGIVFVQSEICLVQVKAETPALRLPQTLFARGGIRKHCRCVSANSRPPYFGPLRFLQFSESTTTVPVIESVCQYFFDQSLYR